MTNAQEDQSTHLSPNPDDMRAHLEHLFGGDLNGHHDGLIEVAWTSGPRHALNSAQLFGTDEIEAAVEKATEVNAAGSNVYVGAALRKRETLPGWRASDDDVLCATCAWVDCDAPGVAGRAQLKWSDVVPTMFVVTGMHPHSRAHLWYRLKTPITDHNHIKALEARLAQQFEGDPKICNPGRVMRLAGSIAWAVKPGRVNEMTRIVTLKRPGAPNYMVEQLEKMCEAVDGNAKTEPPRAVPDNEPTENSSYDIGNRGSLGIGKLTDGREDYMYRTVLARLRDYIGTFLVVPSPQQLHDFAWEQYEAGVYLSGDGRRGPDEFLAKCRYTIGRFERGEISTMRDLTEALASHRAKQLPGQAAVTPHGSYNLRVKVEVVPAFPIDPLSIPRRDWVVKDLFLKKNTSMMVAPPGTGKSLLSLQWAIMIASGEDWGGWHVRKSGPVLVVNTEDDEHEIRRRLWACAKDMGISHDRLQHLHIARNPENIVIAKTVGKSGDVVRTPVFDDILAQVLALELVYFSVDPFAETFIGDENSNSEVKWAATAWREIARRADCACLLVHHTKKYAKGMIGDMDAARGGGAQVGVARLVSTLFNMSADEASVMEVRPEDRTRYIRFDDAKANFNLISGVGRWFEKASIDIPTNEGLGFADQVGVLRPWKSPGLMDGLSDAVINDCLDRINRGPCKADGSDSGEMYVKGAASKTAWVGDVVMEVFGCEELRAKSIIKAWTESGLLVEAKYHDAKSRNRTGVRADDTKRPGVKSHVDL